MFVRNIEITSFRNLDSCRIEFDPGVNVFYGLNGVGKTNLLEAVFVLMLARSPRGANDAVLLKSGAEYYRIEGEIDFSGRSHELAVAYQGGGRKRITVDRVGVRAAELYDKCTAVAAAPEDITLLSGPPSNRRDFINTYLSQSSPTYIADLSDYQKALAQKNAFLKQDDNAGETPFDDLLVQYGSAIMQARAGFLLAVSERAAKYYEKISGGQKLAIAYRPSVETRDLYDRDAVERAFYEKLKKYFQRERIIQSALVGPHRDDVDMTIQDYPARTHGSQGEIRTAAVSLKLGVYDYLHQVRRVKPVLLLDEIFAELDDGRKSMLADIFGQFGQVFITAATRVPGKLLERARIFHIENGVVQTG
nr:DNA replication/repair protein RecF [candidate division Zixibacteria bacterium]